jgi:hypothetical protein
VNRRAARLVVTGLAAAGCFAAPLTPVHADQASERSLVSVRNATADYVDFAASQADGFTTLVTRTDNGASCITNAAGDMGQHYANVGRVGDGIIQRQRPEVLLYEPQADGSKALVGVEYVVIASQWFEHHDSPPVLFGQEFHLMTSNPYGLPPFFELHAWAWRDNPAGAFEDWNPAVSC